MKQVPSFAEPQTLYRAVKKWEGAGCMALAALVLIYGLIFDRRAAVGSIYIFIYGLGYYSGKHSN